MEKFFEQNVAQDNPERYEKRARVFNIIRFVVLTLAVFCLLLAFISPVSDGESEIELLVVVLSFLVYLFPSVFLFALFAFFTRLRTNCIVAYDYFISGRDFYIVKVFNNAKRKRIFLSAVSDMQIIAKTDSDSHTKHASSPGIKKVFACPNPESDKVMYALFNNSSGKTLLYFEPSAEMIHNIRLSLGKDIVEKIR